MPANTLNEMILGFSVILGILVLYTLSLLLRIRKSQRQLEERRRHTPPKE
jgi:hypothetical protein